MNATPAVGPTRLDLEDVAARLDAAATMLSYGLLGFVPVELAAEAGSG